MSFAKEDLNAMNYKKNIIELVRCIEEEKYLRYIYTLVKELLGNNI